MGKPIEEDGLSLYIGYMGVQLGSLLWHRLHCSFLLVRVMFLPNEKALCIMCDAERFRMQGKFGLNPA